MPFLNSQSLSCLIAYRDAGPGATTSVVPRQLELRRPHASAGRPRRVLYSDIGSRG